MNRFRVCLVLAIMVAGIGRPLHAASAEKPETTPPPPPDARAVVTSDEGAKPVYRPPLRGAPGGRVGGSTRSAGGPIVAVAVLAPDHTGLTTSEQPSLYWHISSVSNVPVEITLIGPRAIKPLLQLTLPVPVDAGVHAIRLAEHGIHLQAGIAYRWYVAVMNNADRRSKDVLAGGAIERVALPEIFDKAETIKETASAVSRLADAGLWYDAVAAISERIDAAPADPTLRAPRAALLAQVGLPDIDK